MCKFFKNLHFDIAPNLPRISIKIIYSPSKIATFWYWERRSGLVNSLIGVAYGTIMTLFPQPSRFESHLCLNTISSSSTACRINPEAWESRALKIGILTPDDYSSICTYFVLVCTPYSIVRTWTSLQQSRSDVWFETSHLFVQYILLFVYQPPI